MPDFEHVNKRLIFAHSWGVIEEANPYTSGEVNPEVITMRNKSGASVDKRMVIKLPRAIPIDRNGIYNLFLGSYIEGSDYSLQAELTAGTLNTTGGGISIRATGIVDEFNIDEVNWNNLVTTPSYGVEGFITDDVCATQSTVSLTPVTYTLKIKTGLQIGGDPAADADFVRGFVVEIREGFAGTHDIQASIGARKSGLLRPFLILPPDYPY
jgi:hypothetical protein